MAGSSPADRRLPGQLRISGRGTHGEEKGAPWERGVSGRTCHYCKVNPGLTPGKGGGASPRCPGAGGRPVQVRSVRA